MEPSSTFTGTGYEVVASNTFSFGLPVHRMLCWWDSGTSKLPNYCMWLQYSVLTVIQWQQDRWAKTRAVLESVACHQSEVGLHLAGVSSYLCDTLVISYKSLLKDVQERHVNSSLKQTHTSLSEWWQRHQIMRGCERETDSCRDGEKEGEKRWREGDAEKNRERQTVFLCLSSIQCSAVPPAVIHWK